MPDLEADIVDCPVLRCPVLEDNIPKDQTLDGSEPHRIGRRQLRLLLHQVVEIDEGCLSFPIGQDDIPQLLQRAENEEGIEDHGHYLAAGQPCP